MQLEALYCTSNLGDWHSGWPSPGASKALPAVLCPHCFCAYLCVTGCIAPALCAEML